MTRKQAVLGIAAGALAAAAAGGVVTVVKYRQGHPHTPETLETLDEVAEHLEVLENVDPAAKTLVGLRNHLRDRGVSSLASLRRRIAEFKAESLDDEQLVALESEFGLISDEADRRNL